MNTNDIKDVCKTLHLAYIADHYEDIPFENKQQFLYDVLEHEVKTRQTTKISRLIKKGKFRELKWLKTYEWSDQIHLPSTTTKKKISELNFIKEHNLMLLGAPGTVKTHLATALGLKACEQGLDVRFYRVADLVGDLEEDLKQGTLQRLKRQIEKCDLLILDELGYVPFQRKVKNYFFTL